MILDSDLAVSPMESPALDIKTKGQGFGILWPIALLLSYFGLTVMLQVASGAYRGEFSAYPDEPAHYVTSVMIWDYIRHFHFESPLAFAQSYYEHYPKVALGHWPPFFYMIQAAWMLLFSASRESVRVELALTTAVLAYSIYFQFKRSFGWAGAALSGLLCVALPLVQTYSDEEMAEILLTAVTLWSVWFFARYAATEDWRDAVWFAVFFALAVLTKGNGWLIAMVPPMVLVATRKLRLLWSRSLLVPLAAVAAVCVPWQLMTMRMAERGWDGGTHPSVGYTGNALVEFVTLFPAILGPVLLGAMALGIAAWCVRPALRGSVPPMSAAMLALLLAVWLFHSVVPAGVEDRKLIIAVPAMLFFVAAGAAWLADRIPVGEQWVVWRSAVVAAILATAFFAGTFSIPTTEHYGFDNVARFIAARPEWKNSKILVSSNSVGEGLLISEMAMLRPDPSEEIVRATKALATVDWTGSRYRCLYPNSQELLRYMVQEDVHLVVVDRFAPLTHYLHDDLVKSMVTRSGKFELVGVFPKPGQGRPADGTANRIEIYQANF